jgi:nifR3 family TIM-barrel protein
MKISMRQYFTDPETRSKAERFHAAEPLSATTDRSVLKTAIPGVSAECSLSRDAEARGQSGLPRRPMKSEVYFGSVRIAPATILAPMAGVTDTVFRRFIKHTSFDPKVGEQSSCGLIMTEFTSADGIYRCRESKRKRYLHFYEDEHPISAQLFGSNPEILAEAAKIVEDSGFDIVDLNLGCPAKKVVKCNGGSGLLRDLPHIRTIFETVRNAVKIPFTVKFRMGWSDNEIVCVELAKLAEDCGLQAVALHARTREQGYSGNARWEWIAAVKDAVKIPVVGNGDIRTPEDAALMVAKTNCDAVMIGRTAPSNPWIFRQIAQYNANVSGVAQPPSAVLYDSPTELDRYHMMKDYFTRLVEEEVSYGALGKMKQFASWFTHGVPGGANLRKAVYEAKNERDVLDAVDKFFTDRVAAASLGSSDEQDPAAPLESMQFADCG